jgi:hypothetical protein
MPDKVGTGEQQVNLPALLRLAADAIENAASPVRTVLTPLPTGEWRDLKLCYMVRDTASEPGRRQEVWVDYLTDTFAQVPQPVVESEGQEAGQETP